MACKHPTFVFVFSQYIYRQEPPTLTRTNLYRLFSHGRGNLFIIKILKRDIALLGGPLLLGHQE